MTQRKEGRQQSHVSPAFNFPHMLAGPREKPVLSAKAASKSTFHFLFVSQCVSQLSLTVTKYLRYTWKGRKVYFGSWFQNSVPG
jgi:hypothetical protein